MTFNVVLGSPHYFQLYVNIVIGKEKPKGMRERPNRYSSRTL